MIVRLVKDMINFAVFASGLGWLLRNTVARRKVSIFVYHDPIPNVLHRHLHHLCRAYNIIRPSQFFEAVKQGNFSSLPPRRLVLTFDDGHVGNSALGQVMRAHGVTGLIYLRSDIVSTQCGFWWQSAAAKAIGAEFLGSIPEADRLALFAEHGFERDQAQDQATALSRAELEALSDVFEFGSHTRFHPILTRCNDAACDHEIAQSKKVLEGLLGHPVRHFAVPNGNYGDREIAMIKSADYATARTSDAGWNNATDSAYHLKILPAADDTTVWWLRAQMTGLTTLLKNIIRFRRFSLAFQEGHRA